MAREKLRVLCLHSFRTSGTIFKDQMRISGLDKQLEDLVDFVYVDAPHASTGPVPADVQPFWPNGPYFEWWNMKEDKENNRVYYVGGEETLNYIDQVLKEQGPFQGFWAFSQGTILATLLLMFQRQGKYLHGSKVGTQFAVLFGGVFWADKFQANPLATDLIEDWKAGPLQIPSIHIIGQRDSIKKFSLELTKAYKDPIVMMHPRGHTIPAMSEEQLKQLREFLEFMSPPDRSSKDRQLSNL